MIPYMVGKLAPNSTYFTMLLVKYVPGRGYFWAVPSQNEDKFVTSLPSPIVERVEMALRYQRMRMLASISLFPRRFSARSKFILILQKRLTPTFILLIIVVLYL